jgi:3-dehydroquinate synthase
MKIIKANLKKRSYNIIVGTNIIASLGSYIKKLGIGSDAYVITNSAIKERYGRILSRTLKSCGFNVRFKLIPDTEKSKSLEAAYLVVKDITRFDKKRRIFIIAFGGGVIGDLAGFIASIYKRGIPYIQVPTTLLAQVDSAIGGKTAVDLAQGKNLVGTFYQPRLVCSDVATLKTLDLRQVKSGLAEVIKYGIIKDSPLFNYLERRLKSILALKQAPLEFIVARCSQIKAKIIQQDEREEKGMRTILNFGHTLGHAIEAAAGFKRYNHGEAIALGMLLAADISSRLGLIENKALRRIESLIGKAGLPVKIDEVPISRIIKAHYRDKKFLGQKNRFVLLEGIGRTKIVVGVPLEIIRQALKLRAVRVH